jgi:Heavy metal associated domain 2
MLNFPEPTHEQTQPIHYQIIHGTRGRFRLRIPQLSNDEAYAKQLNWLMESLDFITSVRINPLAGSLVIYYEPHIPATTVQQSLAV